MRVQKGETSSVVAFAPQKGAPDATRVADDAGEHIVALVQQASDSEGRLPASDGSRPSRFFRPARSRRKSTRI